jgi:hypothetical protein
MRYWAKVQIILGRKKERLILALLIILVVATLANPIRFRLHVEPPLFTARAILHLLGSECLVKFRFDGKVFFVEGRLLVDPCKLGGRLVEFTGGSLFGRGPSAGAAGTANRVACEARATARAAASRRGRRGWWSAQGGPSPPGELWWCNWALVITNIFHLLILGSLFLGLSWLGRRWEVGSGFPRGTRLGRRPKSACVVGRLLLAKKIAHCWGLGRFFTMAPLDAVASLDGRNLTSRGSHFGRICSDMAAFVVPFRKNAMGEILARRGGGRKMRDGVFSAGDCSSRLDSRARPGSLRVRLVSRPRVMKPVHLPDPSRGCGNLHS